MLTFPELLKKIREEADLTQEDLAGSLNVSTILISMIESGSREASKPFIANLAKKLDVRTGSILPFLSVTEDMNVKNLSTVEKSLIKLGEKMQTQLIKNKAKRLKKYGKRKIP
jgi:transcriptional regulator with XRE-family HTH domain